MVEPTTPNLGAVLHHELIGAEVGSDRGEVTSVALLRCGAALHELGYAPLDLASLLIIGSDGSSTVGEGAEGQKCAREQLSHRRDSRDGSNVGRPSGGHNRTDGAEPSEDVQRSANDLRSDNGEELTWKGRRGAAGSH